MADYMINDRQNGVYEISLTANTPVTISIVKAVQSVNINDINVMVHTADTPVYAKLATTVAPKDADAYIVTTGSWVSVPSWDAATLAIVCASPAIVSVYRR